MSGAEVAAILGVISTFIGSMYGTWRVARGDKSKQSTEGAAVLLSGWEKFQAQTLLEVERVRKQCAEQINELKKEHEEDRAEWKKRELEMQSEIDRLKEQVRLLIKASIGRIAFEEELPDERKED